MATFLIGGIWHGAGWTFIIWGLLHGIAIVIHRIWQKLNFKMNIFLAWFITFNFINIAWVFFRAKEFEDVINILKAMFIIDLSNVKLNLYFLIIFLLTIIILISKNTLQLISRDYSITNIKIIYYSIIMAIGFIFLENKKVFLYYDF